MLKVQEYYKIWSSQPDDQAKNRLLAKVLSVGPFDESQIPSYCETLKDADQAILSAWGTVEEETAPRFSCLIGETADENKKKCIVEWWPDDNTHIVTPRFETESEAKAFAAFLFSSLEAE